DVRLFEIGAVVTRQGQAHHVAAAWTGDAGSAHWGASPRLVDFFDVKGLAERIGEALQADFTFEHAPVPAYLVPGRAAVISSGGRRIGVVGLLTNDQDVYVAEMSLDALSAARA